MRRGQAVSQLEPTILRSALQRFLLDPPCSVASFEVNSKPRTGARPSVRLCVGLINASSSVWEFGKGSGIRQSRARVYLERENEVV
jgi:hypothetical protein